MMLRSLQLEAAVFRYILIPGSSQTFLTESCLVPDVRLPCADLRTGKALPHPLYTITRLAEQLLFPILNFLVLLYFNRTVRIYCICNSYVNLLSNCLLSEESAALPELLIWVQSKASALLCCTYEPVFHNSFFSWSPSRALRFADALIPSDILW